MIAEVITPKLPTIEYGEDFAMVAVKISIPWAAETLLMFPTYNRIGTLLLHRLLEAKLTAAGVKLETSGGCFEFNQCFEVLRLADRNQIGAALEIICNELDSLGLSGVAVVGWNHREEKEFRSYMPRGAKPFWFPTNEEIDRDSAQMHATLKAARQASNEHHTNRDTPPTA